MTIPRLKDLTKQHSPDIIFLSETKNPDAYVLKELAALKFDHHYLFSPLSPGAGGLALFWKAETDIQILDATKNFIETKASFKNSSIFSTFIYGAPEIPDRQGSTEKSGGIARPESTFVPFRSFLSACDLFDLKHSGNFLSWRGQRHSHPVHCRLDRAIANSSCSDLFPRACCEYLSFEASDHRPILCTLDGKKRKPARVFRYDRHLRDNPEITALVDRIWQLNTSASVSDRIRSVCQAISAWSKEHYVNSKKEITEIQRSLDAALSNPVPDNAAISRLNNTLLCAYKAEEEYWKQRICLLWLSLGDKNTSFFHVSSKGRKARNRISVLENDLGLPVFEDDQILNIISSYFKEIFTSSGSSGLEVVKAAISPCISAPMNEQLTTIPSHVEIQEALFAIHPDKAPGPDGFSASFFQTNWEAVGPAIVSEIQIFFSSGTLLFSINETHIKLIPKIPSPKIVADYRPIALCNVYYKIISKILSLRLKPVLSPITC
ncbi:uncharacterized protein LOC108850504 [Raphanus sativus]|uniref:Uncharacterized protein LOC108850504 n=1 Tax=Raphanus sativus TaxID=3726 RepID=A0A6J0N4F0_RAPSA|nr:uncharacterized protein LOC108850504 [Raphanus sativus]